MKIDRLYHCINCGIHNYPCSMNEQEKEIVENIKRFIVEVANIQVEEGKINSAKFACMTKEFYGHYLSWNKNTWKKSAKIVYDFYKARKIIEKIQSFDKMFGLNTIGDKYNETLNFFYTYICKNEDIVYGKAPIDLTFEFYPEEALNDVLKDFKTKFE